MRSLLCLKCSASKQPGERLAYGASADGPAEYERVVFGTAREPLPKNRSITVITDHEEKLILPSDHHDCDGCGGPIRPGDRCCGHSAWIAGRTVVPWENEYLMPEGANAPSQDV